VGCPQVSDREARKGGGGGDGEGGKVGERWIKVEERAGKEIEQSPGKKGKVYLSPALVF